MHNIRWNRDPATGTQHHQHNFIRTHTHTCVCLVVPSFFGLARVAPAAWQPIYCTIRNGTMIFVCNNKQMLIKYTASLYLESFSSSSIKKRQRCGVTRDGPGGIIGLCEKANARCGRKRTLPPSIRVRRPSAGRHFSNRAMGHRESGESVGRLVYTRYRSQCLSSCFI
jgi:hypothetical protein